MTAEGLAKIFHSTYERLAPQYGHTTNRATAVPWDQMPEKQKQLMLAVCTEVLRQIDRYSKCPDCGRPAHGINEICHARDEAYG